MPVVVTRGPLVLHGGPDIRATDAPVTIECDRTESFMYRYVRHTKHLQAWRPSLNKRGQGSSFFRLSAGRNQAQACRPSAATFALFAPTGLPALTFASHYGASELAGRCSLRKSGCCSEASAPLVCEKPLALCSNASIPRICYGDLRFVLPLAEGQSGLRAGAIRWSFR